MEIKVKRFAFNESYTIGKLFINGEYYCDTLENKVRPQGVKIFGETAIPAGEYNVTVNYSVRFKKYMPEIENVPNFQGIRIHSGNTDKDTNGCILVGKNTIKGKLTNSIVTFIPLMMQIEKALKRKEKVKIIIE